MRILISGAGVAGPTLAYWLLRGGHDVTIVEHAPALRQGGYIVDFWGLGYQIAEQIGVLPRIRELGYQVREVRLVNRHGRTSGGLDVDVFNRATNGRFTSVRRSDVSATIYRAIEGRADTLFGDSVASIADIGGRLRVGFEDAASRDVDLVIGADGLHSRVRDIVFGQASTYEVSLGYHVAAFEVDGYRPRDELVYVSHGVAGREISRFSMRDDRTLFLCVFRDECLPPIDLSTDEARKAALSQVFADVGWEAPAILDAMRGVREIYFDRVSQIRMPHWSRGRVALVGDAAACVSLLAGEGTGLAMTEAYILAGELLEAGDDHVRAFENYEHRLRAFVARKQAAAARFASAFAPRTRLGIVLRNVVTRLMAIPFVADYFVARELRDDLALPAYSWRLPG